MRLRSSAALLVALLGCSTNDLPPNTDSSAAVAKPAATPPRDTVIDAADRGRTKGDSAAKLWLIMASDYQCPYCKVWHDDTYPTILREYVNTGKVRMAYINFPISSIHPNALPAAEAAMCASPQGKFWEVHDGIFKSQGRWSKLPDAGPHFDSLASGLGVDMTPWRSCMSLHQMRPLIGADYDRLSRGGVSSTPTFFVGSQKVEGAITVKELKALIDAALATPAAPAPRGP